MLVLEMKPDEVVVLYTADGPIVLRLGPETSRAKVCFDAPKSVKIAREPVTQHPLTPKR